MSWQCITIFANSNASCLYWLNRYSDNTDIFESKVCQIQSMGIPHSTNDVVHFTVQSILSTRKLHLQCSRKSLLSCKLTIFSSLNFHRSFLGQWRYQSRAVICFTEHFHLAKFTFCNPNESNFIHLTINGFNVSIQLETDKTIEHKAESHKRVWY